MILVDTTPLVALCDGREARHAMAVTHLRRLTPRGLLTCEAVLTEACFHLPHQAQRQRLLSMIDEFEIGMAEGAAAEGFWRDVMGWLLKYSDHDPDWADGCLAVLAGQNKRLRVWTYDREFRTTWRRPDGTAIPMAVP